MGRVTPRSSSSEVGDAEKVRCTGSIITSAALRRHWQPASVARYRATVLNSLNALDALAAGR